MTLRCVENKKPHCQIPIQQRGGLQGASGIAEVLAKETCYSSKNRAFLRNIYIKLQEYVRKFQAIDRSACNACGAWSSASGNAEVLAKKTCDSSKNQAYLRNIYIKLQEYVRKFQAIDRSACNSCGAWSSASGNAEVLAKETCDSSKNQAYLRNIYIKLQEYVRKFQAIDRSACSACGAWSSASGNAVLAKETCDSSKNRAYLRNIYIKLQEYARNFSAIDRSACDACGALGATRHEQRSGKYLQRLYDAV
jgi:hypothetical protein